MVIVNTCGFIDSAVQESLEAIGEALKENGKVIVTGCLGAKEDQIREVHPKVLEITARTAMNRCWNTSTTTRRSLNTTRSSAWCRNRA